MLEPCPAVSLEQVLGAAHASRAASDQDPGADLRAAPDYRVGLPYHYLERVDFNGSGEIRLTFNRWEVTVGGTHLERVYRRLLSQTVGHLRVVENRFPDAGSDGQPLVLRITIHERDI